jgi:large subunit ribosomal protein L5
MTDLRQLYRDEIAINLKNKFGFNSIMQVPRLTKITLNMGVGEAVTNKKVLDLAVSDLTLISGQKAVITRARKSNAGFKIRSQWPIGCKVTLRRKRMYEFLERLIFIAIPRIRDFRGFGIRSFDGMGNYSFGVREQIIFPEIKYDSIDAIRGLDITITTTAQDNQMAYNLLAGFSFPFKEKFKEH